MFTRPIYHYVTVIEDKPVIRASSPAFSLPVPAYMREPGTNYVTIITAEGTQMVPGR